MDTQSYPRRFAPFAWAMAATGLALVLFAFSPLASECPLAVLGIVAFLLVQLLLPACRPCMESPLCPANIAQLFFWVQLVLVPLLIGFYGIAQATLPRIPSSESINVAICLRVLAYVCFCLAFQAYHGRKSQPRGESDEPVARPSFFWIAGFAMIGLLGWLLFYGGVGGFLEYVSSPLIQKERELEPTTLPGAAGNFMRHFLGFAIVWAWSSWILRREKSSRSFAVILVTGSAVGLLVLANFSYNRGNLLAPILGLAAAYSAHVRRISFAAVAFAGVVVLAGAFTFGWYRSTNMQITDLSTDDLGSSLDDPQRLVEFVQVYASGPQLTGYLIDQLDVDERNCFGQTLLASMLYPVPVVGKPFREMSGVVVFNDLIYGDPINRDQNIPYDGELFMNFHIPGVVLGFLLLGWFQAVLQRRFLSRTEPIQSYVYLTLAVWTIFPGSLPVLSQLCIYSFWPIYAFAVVKLFTRTQRITEPETPAPVFEKGWATP